VLLSDNIVRNINTLGVLGLSVVLAMGLWLQISLNELPCPLCLLQRVGFVLVMFGFMLNVVRGLAFSHYGIIILGALFGAGAAMRQVLLHIVPGTGTYGSPVLSLHFYSWSFIIFSASILAVALLLLFSHPRKPEDKIIISKTQWAICGVAIAITALNAIAVFLECGPFVCPENPVTYKLLH
jgi:disulfide bond formation protein DsbB